MMGFGPRLPQRASGRFDRLRDALQQAGQLQGFRQHVMADGGQPAWQEWKSAQQSPTTFQRMPFPSLSGNESLVSADPGMVGKGLYQREPLTITDRGPRQRANKTLRGYKRGLSEDDRGRLVAALRG